VSASYAGALADVALDAVHAAHDRLRHAGVPTSWRAKTAMYGLVAGGWPCPPDRQLAACLLDRLFPWDKRDRTPPDTHVTRWVSERALDEARRLLHYLQPLVTSADVKRACEEFLRLDVVRQDSSHHSHRLCARTALRLAASC
jgi:hypothetical protein